MAKCKFCSQEVPRAQLFKHQWDKHRDEMLKQVHQAHKGSHKKQAKGSQEKLVKSSQEKLVQAGIENKETYQLKGRFVTKEIDLPGDLLVLYWLAKEAFPEYDASEGQWIEDCITQFYAEHSEELGFGKLFDKTFEVVRA